MEMAVTPVRRLPEKGPIVAPDLSALTSLAAAPSPSGLPAGTTAAHDAAAEPWPEPDLSLLDEPRPDVPPFPIAVLPRPWRPWVEQAARGAGAAVDHVALSLLTTAASLIGVDRRIAPSPSWSEPCILWTALVGPASSGKTPAVETSLRLVRALQAGLEEAHAEAVRQYHADMPARQAEWNAWCAQTLKAGGLPRPLAELHPPPVGPRRLTAIADDAGSIAETLPYAAGSVLLLRDDRAAWFQDMVRAARGEGAGSLWLQAWAGGASRVAHNGKVVASLDCTAVSILGTLRPGQLAEALGDALVAGDEGVASRFLFAWPQRPPFHALRAVPAPPHLDAEAALACLRDMEGEDRALPLAGDALVAFDGFRQAHHEGAPRHDDPQAAWWGKGPGTVLRLAGVLTFLDWSARADGTPEPARVPPWAIEAGAALWGGYLWPHAQAVLGADGAGAARDDARRALRWLRARGICQISREDIRVKAMSRTVNADGAAAIIATLEGAAWLRGVEYRENPSGPPLRRWLVNPLLAREPRIAPAHSGTPVSTVIPSESEGSFLGRTVQVAPPLKDPSLRSG